MLDNLEVVHVLYGAVAFVCVYLAYLCGKDVNCLACKDGRTECKK